MSNAKKAFLLTYQTPGGAAAFWLMVAGCVGAIVLAAVLPDGAFKMAGTLVAAFLAVFKGQQFTSALSYYMIEVTKENKKNK